VRAKRFGGGEGRRYIFPARSLIRQQGDRLVALDAQSSNSVRKRLASLAELIDWTTHRTDLGRYL